MSPGTEHLAPGTSAEPCHHHLYHFPENAFKMVWIVPPLRSALYINCNSLFHCAFWSLCVVLRTSTFTTVHLDIALCGWEDFRTSIVLCNMASVRICILSQKSHWIAFFVQLLALSAAIWHFSVALFDDRIFCVALLSHCPLCPVHEMGPGSYFPRPPSHPIS